MKILIAHSDGEEDVAEALAIPLRNAGFEVAHGGTVMLGDSVIEEASKLLLAGAPLVLCGTVRALGTGWAHRLVNAARKNPSVRIFAVQIEKEAYIEPLALDGSVGLYWQDKIRAERELIEALRKYYPLPTGLQPGSLTDDAERRYRELALASCDIIDLANLPENDRHVATRQLELRRLYVALRVRVEIASGVEAETAQIEAIEKRRDSLRGRFSAISGKRITTVDEDPRKRIPIGHRLAAARRLVVLGDQGSGKTTLIRWIATAYLLRLKEDSDLRALPDVSTLPYADWLPVIIRCRDLDQSCLTGSLEDLLRHTLRKAELKETEARALRSAIVDRLTQGRALLLLDGLDEITDPSIRARFCQQLDNIQIAYPNAPMIVTSRIVGYREMGNRLGRAFEHVTVADLTWDDKDDFARRWCNLTERPERRAEATAELIHDIHSTDRIERLTANPMLLTTMALVKRKVGRLPSRRADLYWDALEVLLNWRREIDEPIDHHEAVPQLEYIAYAMCEKGTQSISEDEIIALLERMRDEYPQIHPVQKHSPQEFLHMLERRTGILVQAGHVRDLGRPIPTYEFRHLTFQEYLAGLALVDGRFPGRNRALSLTQNVAPLAGRVADSGSTHETSELAIAENWSEALRLCVACCNDDNVDGVISAILDPLETEDARATQRPRAVLAALSLADEPNVSEALALRVLRMLVSQVTENDGIGPVRTGVDLACKEISASRWAPSLITLLVEEFISRDERTRRSFGSLCAMVSGAAAPSGKTELGEWLLTQIRRLQSGDKVEAIDAALSIMEIAYRGRILLVPGMIDALMALLKEGGPPAQSASWALYWLNSERTKKRWRPTIELEQFLTLLTDGSVESVVIRQLIVILGREKDKRAVPVLIVKLDDPNDKIQQAAALALGSIGDRQAIEPLISALNNSNEPFRLRILDSLSRFQGDRAVSFVMKALEDPSEEVRASVVRSLGGTKHSDAVEPLLRKLDDSSSGVRIAAIEALGQIGDSRAESRFMEMLTDKDPEVRGTVVGALHQIGGVRAIDAVASCFKDRDNTIVTLVERILDYEAVRQFKSGNISQSAEIFRKLATALPDEDHKNNLAYCLILLGKYEEAKIQLELVDSSLTLNSPLYRHNRGVLSFLMGDVQEGVRQVEESLVMIGMDSTYDPREVVCMLVLQDQEVVSVDDIPVDAAALLNLHAMGRLSKGQVMEKIRARYDSDGDQWTAMLQRTES